MATRLSHGHPLDFGAAVALVFTALIVGACRWWRLLHEADLHIGAPSLGRIYAVATFSNTFLPTSVGGDVTRGLLVARRPPLLTRVAVTIVIDRLGGLVGLLGMAWLALAIKPANVPENAKVFLIWVTVAVAIGLVDAGGGLSWFATGTRCSPQPPGRERSRVEIAGPSLRRRPRHPTRAYKLKSPLPGIDLVAARDARALHRRPTLVRHGRGLTLVTIVTLIPISIGGFGIREGTYVVLLAGAGIGATDATLISVLSVATLFVASLPGAFLLMRGGLTPALKAASQ